MMLRPAIDIVIVNWNAGAVLEQCVLCAARASKTAGIEVEIIVVDNASTDGSLARARDVQPDIRTIANRANLGFAKACNLGAQQGCGEYILFLNPDAELSAEALLASYGFLRAKENDRYALCGVQMRDPAGTVARSCARTPMARHMICGALGLTHVLRRQPLSYVMADWDHSFSSDVMHVIGAYYFVRRSVFSDVGGFDERFFVYLEDLDLSWRIQQAGWRCRYIASAWVKHIGGGTSSGVKAERLMLSLESRLKFVRKHFRPLVAVPILTLILVIEPLVRILGALIRLRFAEVKSVAKAYSWLLQGRTGREIMAPFAVVS